MLPSWFSAGTPAGLTSGTPGGAGPGGPPPRGPATYGRVDGFTAQLNAPSPPVTIELCSRSGNRIGAVGCSDPSAGCSTGDVSVSNALSIVSVAPFGASPRITEWFAPSTVASSIR